LKLDDLAAHIEELSKNAEPRILGRAEDYEEPPEVSLDNIRQKIRAKIKEMQEQEPYQYGSDYWTEFLEDLLE